MASSVDTTPADRFGTCPVPQSRYDHILLGHGAAMVLVDLIEMRANERDRALLGLFLGQQPVLVLVGDVEVLHRVLNLVGDRTEADLCVGGGCGGERDEGGKHQAGVAHGEALSLNEGRIISLEL